MHAKISAWQTSAVFAILFSFLTVFLFWSHKHVKQTKKNTHTHLSFESLLSSQRQFTVSDPSLPDNPIVFASPGFLEMTGYQLSDVRELERRVDQSLVSAPFLEPEVRGAREGEADR